MPLGSEVGLCAGDIVLDEDTAPPSKKTGQNLPQLSALVRCFQTAEWIKMPLGMEVGFGPGDFVLDGEPSLAKTRSPCLLWANGCMDHDATWYGGSLSPGNIVLDGDSAPPNGPCLFASR